MQEKCIQHTIKENISLLNNLLELYKKSKTYTHTPAVSKTMYIDRLDNTVNKYNNIYHRTIKTKPRAVKTSTYNDFNIESNTPCLSTPAGTA